MRIAVPITLLFTLLVSVLAPGRASASGGGADAIAEGRRLALEARFGEALAAFDRAAASSDLTKDDLVALLEGRAIVHHGQRDDEAFTQAARGLASIAPDYTPSRQIPPRLARRLREAMQGAAPLAVEASAERSGDAVVVTSHATGDAGSLVTRLVVSARVGNAAYVTHEGAEVRVQAAPTQGVSYFVRALGPGGAPLAAVGSEETPEVLAASELPQPAHAAGTTPTSNARANAPHVPTSGSDEAEPLEDVPPPEGDDGLPVWPFIVGGAVITVALLAIIVALAVPSDDTTPSLPGVSL